MKILSEDEVRAMPAGQVAPKVKKSLPPASTPIQGSTTSNYWPIEDLPSKGFLYPSGVTFLGRPLNVLEVKKLSSMNEVNADFIVNETISKCIKVDGISVDDIVVSDKAFILYWLRANTYKNSGFLINYTCPHCEKDAEYKFSLEVLDTKYLDEKFANLEPITLPESKSVVKIKHLTIRDESLIKNLIKSYQKSSIIKLDSDLAYTCAQIEYVEGIEFRSLKDRYDYLMNCHPSDYSYIESYINHISFGVRPFVEATCPHEGCGLTSIQELFFRPEFFIPEHKFG
jgi:hypothetical protein